MGWIVLNSDVLVMLDRARNRHSYDVDWLLWPLHVYIISKIG